MLANYGKISIMWFDTDGRPTMWDPLNTNALVRGLQPQILIDNRLEMATWDQWAHQRLQTTNEDYCTPEQRIGAYDDRTPWETCLTVGTQWAWKPDDQIKSPEEVIATLAQCVGEWHTRQVLTAAATPLTGITKVVVDPRQGFTACAIDTSSDLWCWGCPNFDASGTYSSYATKVVTSAGGPAFTGVTDVAVGEFHSCAITSDGTLWCWGANDSGQLGTGDTTGTPQVYPAKVPYFQSAMLEVQVLSVAVGSNGGPGNTEGVTCASTGSGHAYCWGSNGSGALQGTINGSMSAYSPVEMLTTSGGAPLALIASVQIVSGSASPCVVNSTGGVLCWGAMPHVASWPSPFYPSTYQEGGSFPAIMKLCGNTGYGNTGTLGTTFLDTNGIYHQGGEAFTGVDSPQPITCGP